MKLSLKDALKALEYYNKRTLITKNKTILGDKV